ncbi:hypothetical protein FBQ96_13250 [Nitrospirales bacterium NOB]|nr:MAG: hypothetical protein UZ03_NOB001003099 [Nitrospira sp. OLB3]MBV6471313.1 hypothetical protein [Nitrospirota bacterium]MCE7966589.1 hypothetical protein [Nitrospira sp. NTP2]MCK6492037.1 hypothetical protein [Nitrospira sp.]MDL1890521.1 hypothetical protein [Nitrospirales bacterium NOB]MEB2338829.1 hypothetical protein [Nitrospirales bacterium]
MVRELTILAGLILLVLGNGCASEKRPGDFFHEDQTGQYYATKTGRVLHVDPNGTVYDITCVEATVAGSPVLPPRPLTGEYSHCPQGWLVRLGQVPKLDGEWDMRGYNVAAETGTCEPLLSLSKRGRFSCWNRMWEVPVLILAGAFGLFALAL